MKIAKFGTLTIVSSSNEDVGDVDFWVDGFDFDTEGMHPSDPEFKKTIVTAILAYVSEKAVGIEPVKIVSCLTTDTIN